MEPRFKDEKLQEFYEEFKVHSWNEIESRRKMEEVLEANTKAVQELTSNTKDLVEAWNHAKGFLRIMAAISQVVKMLLPFGIFIWAVYYFGKTGNWPKG